MKPITINITNLIGTMVIIGNEENASAQIQENVTDALNKVLKSATESSVVEKPIKDYSTAKSLLQDLIETASRAIIAIEDNKEHWEICNIADEEIEELTKQISSAILGDCTSVINRDVDIVK